MADEVTKNALPVLKGTNFATWQWQMKAILMEQKSWTIVDGTETRPEAPAAGANAETRDRINKSIADFDNRKAKAFSTDRKSVV